MSLSSPVPEWFSSALAYQPEVRTVLSDRTRVRYRCWGDDAARRLMVLVHGGGAHAGWWDHIGPHLACAGSRVVAVDLSGHGDSDWRETYSLTEWADDVAAVILAERAEAAVLVGHSLGGFVTLAAASRHWDLVTAVAVLDSPVRWLEGDVQRRLRAAGQRQGPMRLYPDREAAMARFRPLPMGAEDYPDYVLSHVAAASVREWAGGWSWKFDPKVFASSFMEPSQLETLAVPLTLVAGSVGVMSASMRSEIVSRTGTGASQIVLPGVGHNLMLDQPIAVIGVLLAMAQVWWPGGDLWRPVASASEEG